MIILILNRFYHNLEDIKDDIMNGYLERLENGEDAKVIILDMSEKIGNPNDVLTDTFICTDFKFELSDMKQRIQKQNQPPTGDIFTIKIFKR